MAAMRILKRAAPWLAGVLVLLALLLLGLLRTEPGHRVLEWMIGEATGGEVVVTGLDGTLPNHLAARQIVLRDANGAWLQADDVSLEWSALSALTSHIVVRRISATGVSISRRPTSATKTAGSTPRIDIDALSLPHIALGTSLAGHPALLAARGSLHYVSRHDLSTDIVVTRPGSGDRYVAQGAIADDVAKGTLNITEGADGLLGQLIGLPGLRPVNLRAIASGSRAANAVSLALSAGALSANGQGTLSLADRRANIAFTAQSPAMQLDPALGWASLAVEGHFIGGFDAPDVTADLRLAGFAVGGLHAAEITADVRGQGGALRATARIDGLRLSGNAPGLLAGAPIMAIATADLSAAARPVQFSLTHPVVKLVGTATTRGKLALDAKVTIPSLAPFGALTGGPLLGAAALMVNASSDSAQTAIALNGTLSAQGTSLAARMLGHASLTGRALWRGADIAQSQLAVDGSGLALRVSGTLQRGLLDYHASLDLKDLSRLTNALTGHASLSGRITGPAAKALVEASGTADTASKGFARQHLDISLRAIGLPQPASATFKAHGAFDKAPLTLDAVLTIKGADHLLRVSANWKSLAMRADIALPAKGSSTGSGTLDVKSLNDLSPFTRTPAKGSLHLAAQMTAPGGRSSVALQARAADLVLAGSTLGAMSLDGTVSDPFVHPSLALKLGASHVSAQGWSGEAKAGLLGPLDGIAIDTQISLVDSAGAPAHVAAKAILDAKRQTVSLEHLNATWRGDTAALTTTAQVNFSNGIGVDHLRLAAGGGTITLSGQVAPKLALQASAEGIRAEIVSLFLPQISVSGTLSATADLSGTLAAPQGSVTLLGRGLRDRVYAVTSATAADLDARAVLHGTMATVNATVTAGKNGRLTLTGEAPLTAAGALNLRLAGRADLALLDPVLVAGGQRMRGTIEIDAAVSGSLSVPRIRGSASLSDGDFQDFARGIRLQNIKATLKAQKEGIHLVALSATAGSGTITGSGTLDAWAPGMPLDLTIRADNARPIASDLLTASLSGSARLTGKLEGDMTLKGAISVPRAEVMLPQSFPPEVRTLNVRHRGEQPPQAPKHGGAVTVDLTVQTTGPVTLRGRGIDADLGGTLDISGSSKAPRIGGAFQMQRGTLSIAGQTLTFTTGKITFDGTGVRGRMDPALDFVASETSGGVTATLTVGGYASLPTITLSSTPQLPQDEVLARLLFQKSATQISPLQLAEGAQALASMAGIGSGFSPLASIRGGLGLDRLSLGSGSGPTTGTTIEAGKYVSHNVYVGARQGISGGTQAQVQIDLTKNLKAQATVSTGASATATKGATAAEDNGSSIGLSYQFNY